MLTMPSTSQGCVMAESALCIAPLNVQAVTQLCKAYRNDGGRVIVILTQQPKLEMEATFRRTIPKNQRFGSSFVFRQACP